MNTGKKVQKGFTIIEVSLVLAIAGLIFLMTFVALPALQRQSRNTAREEDVTNLVAAIKKYQTNNRGALPGAVADAITPVKYDKSTDAHASSWAGFLRDYMDGNFVDPSTGESYNLVVQKCGADAADKTCTGVTSYEEFTIYVVTQAKCAGDETRGTIMTTNPRKFAVLYKLEGSGLYCENS